MRVLFINGQPYLPQEIGGVETSTQDLCRSLGELGHAPSVMAGLKSRDAIWLLNRLKNKLTGQLFPADRHNGIPVYRGWGHLKGFADVADREQPDAIVIQTIQPEASDIAALAIQRNIKTFFYIHDVTAVARLRLSPAIAAAKFIANSRFTARLLQESLGVSCEIIPPLTRPLSPPDNATQTKVTMINPRASKGGDIALEVAARCPDIPFLFVEAWSGDDDDVRQLRQTAAGLANVTWMSAQNDMRAIYGATRLLLMPSQSRETWGKVVTEAHFCGIPVVASRTGALPDTVGPGGLLVEPDAAAAVWVDALRSLWDVPATYDSYAAAARQFAQRDEIEPAHVVARFLDILRAG